MAAPSEATGGTARLSFIDTHHHLQDLTHNHYPWLEDRDAPVGLGGPVDALRRDYLVDDLLADLSGAELVKSVHVQNGWDAADPVGETRWLQAIADERGFPHAIVAFADLARPDVEDVLAGHALHANVRGIRQILNWDEDPFYRMASAGDLMRREDWRHGYALLRRFSMSFDLQIYATQMDDAADLARCFPDTLVVLNHMGMPVDGSAEGLADWAAAMRRLGEAPNVVAKLSGFGIGRFDWTLEEVAPLVLWTVEAFGVERCMFGTNLPFDRLFGPPAKIVQLLGWIADRFGPSDSRKLLQTNAERTYRI